MLDEDGFDSKYAELYGEYLTAGEWEAMISLCKKVLLTDNPTPSLRVELLSGIAMAQVGMAADFTEALKQQGLAIRAEVGMSPEEARQVAENVATCVGLQADGLKASQFPEGEKDAEPE